MASAGSAPPFGTVAAPMMVVSRSVDGVFEPPQVVPVQPLELHPFAHALHYGSSCFEGLKAHRGADGDVRLFRAERHARRLAESAVRLSLPEVDPDHVLAMIEAAVRANLEVTPPAPGALYLRPVLLGTDPNIGAAAAPSADAMLYVIASPVGDYFAGGLRPLTLLVETRVPRTTPQFGQVKTGANYAMALNVTLAAQRDHQADQVLFAPGGDVQETGAANFLLIDAQRVVTKGLDGSFLHGVTRDSVLSLARELGFAVEERDISIDEIIDWAKRGEAALAGTAAVLSGVGTLIVEGRRITVGTGGVGEVTQKLRNALVAVQQGEREDAHGWTTVVA
ncbi:MAG: branched-chain amino acid aminotransferase [Nitriliruptoraceae bacterium]